MESAAATPEAISIKQRNTGENRFFMVQGEADDLVPIIS
jgi:hypothetical protein